VEADDNWDAAWVFVKYRLPGDAWRHARLAPDGHAWPTGVAVDVPIDGMGAFVYRGAPGYGPFEARGVRLVWDAVGDGVPADAELDAAEVFGIEMVYVPRGSFTVGTGGTERGAFRTGSSEAPFVVSSQAAIVLGEGAGQLGWLAVGQSGTPDGSTNPEFPTGFDAFYVMRHQVTQGQYVNFLNTLTQAQADARRFTGTTYRHAITGDGVGSYETSTPFVAMNHVSWADGAAFAAWAGLRPMTELEFEKAARGPLAPVPDEYAWGSTSMTQATGLENAGTDVERPTPGDANANYHDLGNPIGGPVRVGSFAVPGDGRRDAGAGFYGALELTGNLWERAVTVGNAEGRTFTGTHGDGALDAGGNASVASWPGADGVGAGFRGGSWRFNGGSLRVSDRSGAALTRAFRDCNGGWRGVRSAP